MTRNVGTLDRLVRFIVGPLMLLVGIAGYLGAIPVAIGPVPQALGALVLVVLGVIFTVTAATRTCPLYLLFGVSTRRVDD